MTDHYEQVPPWRLAGRNTSLSLGEAGFRLSRPFGLRPSVSVPYSDITHLATGSRGLWIGTRSGVLVLYRTEFAETEGPEALRRALVQRISTLPQGAEQLARHAEIDQLGRHPARKRVGPAVAVLCVAVFALQRSDPFAEAAGAFIPSLVGQGEYWRILTANFFHADGIIPLHLLLNLVPLLLLAIVVERPLGAVRCAVVVGASALGAMAMSALAGLAGVIGASGIVFGMVGAAVCLEIHFPHRLPVWWRLPRPLLLLLLVWEGGVALFSPYIAGAAHFGGFLAGYGATRMVAEPSLLRLPARAWVKLSAGALAAGTLVSFLGAVPLIRGDEAALADHGRNLLATEGHSSSQLNNLAWRIVTESRASEEGLQVAVALAERAVDETARRNPNWLDTLAEALFASGDSVSAVSVIEEAIRLAPGARYYREQRRRFIGDRPADDRPAPPEDEGPWQLPGLPPWHPSIDFPTPEPGIEI